MRILLTILKNPQLVLLMILLVPVSILFAFGLFWVTVSQVIGLTLVGIYNIACSGDTNGEK